MPSVRRVRRDSSKSLEEQGLEEGGGFHVRKIDEIDAGYLILEWRHGILKKHDLNILKFIKIIYVHIFQKTQTKNAPV